MGVFTASDIMEVAIRIEENGVNFYKFAEQIAKKEDEKKLFAGLAQAEVNHKKTFEKFFAGMEKSSQPESYEGEFGEYLRSYVDNNLIFTKEIMDKQLAKVTDMISALEFAIQRDWIQFFIIMKLRNWFPHPSMKKLRKSSKKKENIFSLLPA